MPSVSELKRHASALEAEGHLPEALQAFRDCVMRLEGTPEFLRELPLLVRVGDLAVRTGDPIGAIQAYQRAVEHYIRHGRAESVIATGLRIARIRPESAPFIDYTLQLIGAGHPEAARRVLLEVARRSGHEAEAAELEALAGAADRDIATAVERIVEETAAPDAPRRPMSLEDAIAEMRRRSGLAERRSHPDAELPPPPVAPRGPRGRPLVWAVLAAGALLGGAGAWYVAARDQQDTPATVLEGPAPSPPDIAAAAETPTPTGLQPTADPEAPVPGRQVAAPVPPPARGAPAPTGLGLLATDTGVPVLPSAPVAEERAPATAVPDAGEDRPAWMRLPAGAVVTTPVAVIRGLPIRRIENAGRGYRLAQVLPGGEFITITLAPFPGSGVSEPRVTPLGTDSAVGSMRFQGFMVNARAPIVPDSLYFLLARLVEVSPRQ